MTNTRNIASAHTLYSVFRPRFDARPCEDMRIRASLILGVRQVLCEKYYSLIFESPTKTTDLNVLYSIAALNEHYLFILLLLDSSIYTYIFYIKLLDKRCKMI